MMAHFSPNNIEVEYAMLSCFKISWYAEM